MLLVARSLLVALTVLAALAAGALNGRVLCLAGADHVAVEDAGHKHGDDNGTDHRGSDCVDLQPGGTLVRQTAAPAYDHQHALLDLAVVPPAPVAVPCATVRSTVVAFAGTPPALADLACLRSIVLTV